MAGRSRRGEPGEWLRHSLLLLALLAAAEAATTVRVGGPGAADSQQCGVSTSAPCATIKFAAEVRAPQLAPSTGALVMQQWGAPQVVLAVSPGVYTERNITVSVSLGIQGTRVGVVNMVTISCGGWGRALHVKDSAFMVQLQAVNIRECALQSGPFAPVHMVTGGAILAERNATRGGFLSMVDVDIRDCVAGLGGAVGLIWSG